MRHGRDGWVLEEYDYDERTGDETLVYERVRKDTGEVQTKALVRLAKRPLKN